MLPLLVLLEQDGADQAGAGLLVREDLDNVGTALDLLAPAFDRAAGPDLGPVLSGEGREGGQVRLGLGKHVGDLWERGAQRAGNLLVRGGDSLPTGLSEEGGDQGARGFVACRAQAFRVPVRTVALGHDRSRRRPPKPSRPATDTG